MYFIWKIICKILQISRRYFIPVAWNILTVFTHFLSSQNFSIDFHVFPMTLMFSISFLHSTSILSVFLLLNSYLNVKLASSDAQTQISRELAKSCADSSSDIIVWLRVGGSHGHTTFSFVQPALPEIHLRVFLPSQFQIFFHLLSVAKNVLGKIAANKVMKQCCPWETQQFEPSLYVCVQTNQDFKQKQTNSLLVHLPQKRADFSGLWRLTHNVLHMYTKLCQFPYLLS